MKVEESLKEIEFNFKDWLSNSWNALPDDCYGIFARKPIWTALKEMRLFFSGSSASPWFFALEHPFFPRGHRPAPENDLRRGVRRCPSSDGVVFRVANRSNINAVRSHTLSHSHTRRTPIVVCCYSVSTHVATSRRRNRVAGSRPFATTWRVHGGRDAGGGALAVEMPPVRQRLRTRTCSLLIDSACFHICNIPLVVAHWFLLNKCFSQGSSLGYYGKLSLFSTYSLSKLISIGTASNPNQYVDKFPAVFYSAFRFICLWNQVIILTTTLSLTILFVNMCSTSWNLSFFQLQRRLPQDNTHT